MDYYYFILSTNLYTDVIKGQSDEEDIKVDNSSFYEGNMDSFIADFTMSLDNVLGVAGAAGDHYVFINFWISFINCFNGYSSQFNF